MSFDNVKMELQWNLDNLTTFETGKKWSDWQGGHFVKVV